MTEIYEYDTGTTVRYLCNIPDMVLWIKMRVFYAMHAYVSWYGL